MSKIRPCPPCQEQETMLRRDESHGSLSLVASKSFAGVLYAAHEERVYKCKNCGALMYHIDDPNDFMPFWFMIQELPDWAKQNDAA